jgi:hypothetical protein
MALRLVATKRRISTSIEVIRGGSPLPVNTF